MNTTYYRVRRPLMDITSTIVHADGRVENVGPVSTQFTHQRLSELLNWPDMGKTPKIEYRQTSTDSGGWYVTVRDLVNGDRQYYSPTLLFALDAAVTGEDQINQNRRG